MSNAISRGRSARMSGMQYEANAPRFFNWPLQLALQKQEQKQHSDMMPRLFQFVLFIVVLHLSLAFSQQRGTAANSAQIILGNARITVLTSRLIRFEYSSTAAFEDSPSFAFVNRNLPVPFYSTSYSNGVFQINTDFITVSYTNGTGVFSSSNLNVSVPVVSNVWYPGASNSGNLFGTFRTLDGCSGPITLNCSALSPAYFCNYGLVSKDGWVLVDDSGKPVFDNDPTWPWVTTRADPTAIDWYLFAHGHDYRAAMFDFTRVSGQIPIPPRFAFGIFFSRYWAYSDIEEKDIVRQYEMHSVPLDTFVTDMDWHETFYQQAYAGQLDQAGQPVGWTGYTWDNALFANPSAFLGWCKRKGNGLKNTLNLHPASGVQPHELRYPQMAEAMGIDPSTKIYVPFNITNKLYAQNLYNIMLKPLEQQGIDFWWLDWQQEETTALADVNPTFWLNYCFFTNPDMWQNNKRPMLLHRWGGLGNHRYQIGFSGDVWPNWGSLTFEVYFTMTAANVGYGYWSHDIGGHQALPGPELYTRWVQFGIFSPIFRPHCTKSGNNDRRIWVYPLPNFIIMRNAIHFRSQLVPYIYNQSRTAFDTGIALVHPLYYDWPESAEAYSQSEYMFGEAMLIAPITSPMDNDTGLAAQSVWLPPGYWIDMFRGKIFSGPTTVNGQYSIAEIPAFVKAGSIIPMLPPQPSVRPLFGAAASPAASQVVYQIYLSQQVTSFQTNIYEDDGQSTLYATETGFGFTTVSYDLSADLSLLQVTIQPLDKPFNGLPAKRQYQLRLLNTWPPSAVSVNGETAYFSTIVEDGDAFLYEDLPLWQYDGKLLATSVYTSAEDSTKPVQIKVQFIAPLQDNLLLQGYVGMFARAFTVKALLDTDFPQVFQQNYDAVVQAAGTPERLIAVPQNATTELPDFASLMSTAASQISALNTTAALIELAGSLFSIY